MADLPSILGGLAQGFIDFGKGAVDLFGTGGAAIGDLIQGTGTKNQNDFRKWLYNTNDNKDAAAKGLGTALNGVQTALDYIPGVNALTRNPLGNAAQGALGGLADEFKTYGKDYDLGRAGQRAAVSAVGAAASGGLADALKGSANPILRSGALQGLARGAAGGAITGGGYAAIDGGDVLQSALQGAGTGALIGGVTGAVQDFKPAKTYDVALSPAEKQARIENAQAQIDDIGPVSRFSNNPDDIAKRARITELQDAIKAYQGGFDTVDDYKAAMANKKANRPETTTGISEKQQAQDYMMAHRPTQTGIYADNLLAEGTDGMVYPKDVYDNPQYYTFMYGETPDVLNETMAQLNAVRNNPNGEITIYRATPGNTINDGDWITLSKTYADLHNQQQLGGKGNVLSQKVNVRDVQPSLDDLAEWGYYPQKRTLETTLASDDMAVNAAKLTPEQEAYFKDSVIREPGGGLKTVYHGTDADFNTFGEIKTEPGYWFTEDKDYAASHGKNLKTVNLNMKNPLDLNTTEGDNKLVEYLRECFGENASESDIYTKKFRNFLKNKGYDGMIWEHSGKNTYIAFEPNQIKDVNNLAPTDDMDIMRSAILPDDADLADTLSKQDLAINNAKVAPGQLDLFNDYTPRQKTEAPIEGLDYYGEDIEVPATRPTNPYAPVNGEVTQAMRDRAADILGNWKKNGVPENELYNAINPDTLPLGYKEAINVLDNMDAKKYLKDNLGVTDIKKAKFDKVLDYLFGDNEDAKRARIEMRDQQIESAKQKAKLLGLPGPSKNFVPTVEAQLREEVEYRMAKDISKSLRDISVDAQTGEVMPLTDMNLERLDPKKHSFRTGYTAAADEALSERLGIAPGNTPKYNGKIDVRGAYGRYQHPLYGAGGDVAVFERKMGSPEDAISSIAHERLHSFQNEATNKANNTGRYSKEVEDAFKDLRKDLEQHYKSWDETAKRYGGGRGNTYWNSIKEQEARMLETYLQNKGYTDAPEMKSKYRAGEWGNEINPAFDKFFDKLRDLSKRGVALPALAALFGGGAYMASQENDKEKEVK